MVAVMHFPSSGPLFDSPLVRHAYLLLDFFFVLSGFVIAHSYGHRLSSPRDLKVFLFLRFGRIYPLHLFVLLALILLEATKFLLPLNSTDLVRNVQPFAPQWRGIDSILANLFLLNGFGFYNTWNIPSWSIAVEFFAYLAFAFAVFSGVASRGLLVALGLGALVVLATCAGPTMDVLYGLGSLRCVAGFSFGVLVQRLLDGREPTARFTPTTSSMLEIAVCLAAAALISYGGSNGASFLVAPLFAILVAVFAGERGIVSRFLCSRPLARLGDISFSIYMIHMPLEFMLIKCVLASERISGVQLTYLTDIGATAPVRFIGPDPVVGSIAYATMLIILIGCSLLTRRYVEAPGQRFAGAIVRRLWPASTAETTHLAIAGSAKDAERS